MSNPGNANVRRLVGAPTNHGDQEPITPGCSTVGVNSLEVG